MKKKLFLLLLVTFTVSSQEKSIINYYGEKIGFENVSNYSESKSFESTIKIEGEILSSCPKKGCWMEMKLDNDTVFVKFRDYGFFVPKKGIAGKKAVISGKLSLDTLKVSELKHYAKDAGKSISEISKIKYPEVKISFLADGVIIFDR